MARSDAASDAELCFMPATDQARAVRAGEISPVELVEATLRRIELIDPQINAFTNVFADHALELARQREREVGSGAELGPLHGLPLMVKDASPTAGFPTTYGSPGYRDYVPDESSVAYERLIAAGAIMVAKTAVPEMAFKGVTDSPLTGHTNNPWDETITAGGSSGGSAAAVVSGLGALATGTDGGGSVRAPASCCGAVGVKPSLGRIPIVNDDAVFETTTALGPIARSSLDAALMLSVMAGPDDRDPFSIPLPAADFTEGLADPSVAGLRIAYSENLGIGQVEREVLDVVGEAVGMFDRDLGADVESVDWKIQDPVPIMQKLWCPVAELLLEDLLEREDVGVVDQSIRDMAEAGRGVSGAELYRAATMERSDMYQGLVESMRGFDLLITPTLPTIPFAHPPLGGQGPAEIDGSPIWPYSGWLYLTAVFNFTGHPAVTIPCGFSESGLPIGLQIVGHLHDDARVLEAAAAFEAAAGLSLRPAFAI